jgi:hypothetical protein
MTTGRINQVTMQRSRPSPTAWWHSSRKHLGGQSRILKSVLSSELAPQVPYPPFSHILDPVSQSLRLGSRPSERTIDEVDICLWGKALPHNGSPSELIASGISHRQVIHSPSTVRTARRADRLDLAHRDISVTAAASLPCQLTIRQVSR